VLTVLLTGLRQARKKRHLTQIEVARHARLSAESVCRFEKLRRPASMAAAQRIAEVLNVPMTTLISGPPVRQDEHANTHLRSCRVVHAEQTCVVGVLESLTGSPTFAWVGRWRTVAWCTLALVAPRPTSPVTVTISVAGSSICASGCGRHATTESPSLVSGHRFPRDVILLAVRYYLQLGAAAKRIAGLLADRGVDVSGRTILALGPEVRPGSGSRSPATSPNGGDDVAGR
jgi:DNA-binding XRE family transcriptional regulator